MAKPFYTGDEWTPDLIATAMELCEEVGCGELGLEIRPNQIEIVTAEQMVDAYASVGLPVHYHHWSFGRKFLKTWHLYKTGRMGLAYEMIINSDPCVSYLMETNSMTMQLVVVAHACIGHNAYYNTNDLFRERTCPEFIIDYLTFAKNYIKACERRYGEDAVEKLLDWCHTLQPLGVDKYRRRRGRDEVRGDAEITRSAVEENVTEIDLLIPRLRRVGRSEEEEKESKEKDGKDDWKLDYPEENVLYFIEKNSPILEVWQKEIVRIVRLIWEYFYPNILTKTMNEGTATYTHWYILNRLRERGLIDDGAWLEFTHCHTNVIRQPDFTDPAFSAVGINPYALGFAILRDLERACREPDKEDEQWLPTVVGRPWPEVLREVMRDFADQGAIHQFLSPKVIREFRMFTLTDREERDYYEVTDIADEDGYHKIRRCLAESYDYEYIFPGISVVGAKMRGDRTLHLEYEARRGRTLDASAVPSVMTALHGLWGYRVVVDGKDPETGKTVSSFTIGGG